RLMQGFDPWQSSSKGIRASRDDEAPGQCRSGGCSRIFLRSPCASFFALLKTAVYRQQRSLNFPDLSASALCVPSTASSAPRYICRVWAKMHSWQVGGITAGNAMRAMYYLREFPAAGGLISYGASITDAYRLAGGYAARILKGEKPADLPIQQTV